jgi:hypothetical protein
MTSFGEGSGRSLCDAVEYNDLDPIGDVAPVAR